MTLAIAVLLAVNLAAQTADEEYLKAMQLSDNCQKIQALEAYIAKYAGQGTANEHWAYAYYCLTPCATKNVQKAIEFGEKALTMSGLDEQTKLGLMSTVASLYSNSGQYDKAKAAAQKIIDYGKSSSDAAKGAQITGAGYLLIGQFAEKAADYGTAADNYITAYGILKNPKVADFVKKLGNTLYSQQKFADAEKVFRAFYASAQDAQSAVILGQTLYKAGKIDEALGIYREAYAKKRSGELAYNIAIILHSEAKKKPSLKPEAINALIEASLLYPPQSKALLGTAQNLFLSDSPELKDSYAKIEEHNKAIAELTKTYNEKFGNKTEDDLTDSEKNTMRKLNAAIDAEKQAIAQIQGEQKGILDKFNQLVAQVRAKIGK